MPAPIDHSLRAQERALKDGLLYISRSPSVPAADKAAAHNIWRASLPPDKFDASIELLTRNRFALSAASLTAAGIPADPEFRLPHAYTAFDPAFGQTAVGRADVLGTCPTLVEVASRAKAWPGPPRYG